MIEAPCFDAMVKETIDIMERKIAHLTEVKERYRVELVVIANRQCCPVGCDAIAHAVLEELPEL